MKLKKVIALGMAVTALAGAALKVSAVSMKDIFDAKYYASKYSDLKEAFGDDEEKLYQHFITYGLKEGRNMSPILDVVAYREAYGDLDEAFGDDWDKYVEHFLAYGANEDRDQGVMFNPVQYADAYSDVKEAYGDDLVSIMRHYITCGINEMRDEGTSKGYESLDALKEAEARQEDDAADAPEPTRAPETTETPNPAESPVPTVSPAPEESPAPVESPTPTENPVPTEVPDPVPTDPSDEDSRTEELYKAMIAMKEQYPEGTPWTNDDKYTWHAVPGVSILGGGCVGFAFMLSDAAFGTEAPATKITDVSQVRVGDVVRLNADSHSVIILAVADNGDVTVAEGNYNDSVHWGRVIKKADLEKTFDYLYTRY